MHLVAVLRETDILIREEGILMDELVHRVLSAALFWKIFDKKQLYALFNFQATRLRKTLNTLQSCLKDFGGFQDPKTDPEC